MAPLLRDASVYADDTAQAISHMAAITNPAVEPAPDWRQHVRAAPLTPRVEGECCMSNVAMPIHVKAADPAHHLRRSAAIPWAVPGSNQ